MKLKKIPRYLALSLLTIGASLILGFLSFGGMFALWPVLAPALAAFALSVAYEGEIYLQNIKGAWNKLFKHNALKRELANDYLLEKFLDKSIDTTSKDCPTFFKDYEIQLNLLHKFGHASLDELSKARKKQAEKTLKDMEKWFALQLFATPSSETEAENIYTTELQSWLLRHQQLEWQTQLVKELRDRSFMKLFSAFAGLFMGLGTTYLLVEAFSVIPLFMAIPLTAWPLWIVPMAAIAGSAYGLLTYNAITDMIKSAPLRTWFNKIRNDLSTGLTARNLFITTTAIFLVTLALGLTICTAGTWWTVAKQTPPLFAWMGRMPGFIMGVINPIITGLSAVVFNLQNTSESLELIDTASRKKTNVFSDLAQAITDGFQSLIKHENALQIINPFRLLLKITVAPLRVLFFLGHLVSIGVTADRMPGVSQFFSALLGIISEGFEDYHYFFGHDHDHEKQHHHGHCHNHEHSMSLIKERLGNGHGHHHDLDLPTRVLKFVFSPIYFLAAGWDYAMSKKESLTFRDSWNKQQGIPKEKSVTIKPEAQRPSADWKREHAIYRIERFKEKHLQHVSAGCAIAEEKINALTQLQQTIRTESMQNQLEQAKNNPIYHAHRFFDSGKTATVAFIEELPQRINLRG